MKTSVKALIAAALAGTALLTALPASAGGDWDRDDHHEWRGGPPGHGWGHHHHGHWGPRYYEERIVVRERPVYYPAPVYYAPPPAPVYYAPAPAPRYYPRNPAIVVGVDIPPLVIPLR